MWGDNFYPQMPQMKHKYTQICAIEQRMTMNSQLIEIIQATEPEVKNRSIEDFCEKASLEDLLKEANLLERFRKAEPNLYKKVRALFFLYAIYRFYVPTHEIGTEGIIPYQAFEHLEEIRGVY